MTTNGLTRFLFLLFVLAVCIASYGQQSDFLYGDALPDAPELAHRGNFSVGVRTLEWTNPDQVDVQQATADGQPKYDRKITVEVWYPSMSGSGTTSYDEVMGVNGDPNRPLIPFSFLGRATRDALPAVSEGPYPLVIVSHGYLGSRYLMSYLTENLASKGYVVVAIDHPESTFRQPGKFASTLYYRALDDLFVLDQITKLSDHTADSFLAGLVDPNTTALVGYSMGGYGVLNAAGAGYSATWGRAFTQLTEGSKLMDNRVSGAEGYVSLADPRIKAIVAFAPWGMQRGAWDQEGLKGIHVPTFIVAGDQDDISGYEDGVRAIYERITGAQKYLLVYQQARHNVAPNPPPAVANGEGINPEEFMRYAEPVWDERRINNINQHFVTAFLGVHLKGESELSEYLDLTEDSLEGTWKGFRPRTSIGLELYQAKPGDAKQ